ncbi:Clp protease ClpP [Sodaliphilus sp.]|uniref:Clp protease ClpP n=1 Tax=Sodaliphilus sp. TaxID=2815818 RepID=UPI00388F8459
MAQQYQLQLKGFVGGIDFDRNYVDYVLAQNDEQPVAVLIDSLGGNLATALSIASAFRNHGNVSAHFVGMNASAATIAALGAKHVSMDASAMYLVHKCSSEIFQYGNLNADDIASLIKDLKATKSDLEKLDSNIAEMYARKCKKPACDLLKLMKAGGWLTAKEALEWGFVDEVTDYEDESAPKLTDAVASAMASAGMPIPNVPMADEQSAFGKFIAAITSLFRNKQEEYTPININTTMHKFSLLCAILEAESIAATDGAITITVAQAQAIEDALNAAKQREQSLENEITALRKAPADTTTQVVDAEKHTPQVHEEKSDAEMYVEAYNSATKLFNNLP